MGNASSLPPSASIVARGGVRFCSYEEVAAIALYMPEERASLWLWAVEKLAAERGLTVVGEERFAEVGVADWRAYFALLWRSRHGVVADPPLNGGPGWALAAGGGADPSTMRACVRVRPASAFSASGDAENTARTVTVPLHQRVALVRARHPGLTRAEATARAAAAAKGAGLKAAIVGYGDGAVHALAPYVGAKSFCFDRVLGEAATQDDVWAACSRTVLDAANGRDGCVFCYGQSGSGKTFTMFDGGLVRRALLALLESRAVAHTGAALVVSYVEVFGHALTDLSDGAGVAAERRAKRTRLRTADDVDAFLANGANHKRAAATAMNARSTRAHAVVTAALMRGDGEPASNLVLVDLGGSERVERSKVNRELIAAGGVCSNNVETRNTWADYYKARSRLAETTNINLGLLALKRCVTTMVESEAENETVRIPFMDSKLTQLMARGLAAKSVAAVFCVGREDANAVESIETLNFGEVFRRLRGTDGDARDSGGAITAALRAIDGRVAALQVAIAAKERWEWRTTSRTDVVDAMDTGGTRVVDDEAMELGGAGAVEILPDDGNATLLDTGSHDVRGQVIVGAEAENAELADLLDQRRALLGEA